MRGDEVRDQRIGCIESGLTVRMGRTTPSIRVALPPTSPGLVSGPIIAAERLRTRLQQAFDEWTAAEGVLVIEGPCGSGWEVDVGYSKVILTAEERKQAFNDAIFGKPEEQEQRQQEWAAVEERRRQEVDNHPDNGKEGFWRVDKGCCGTGRSGLVWASSYKGAIETMGGDPYEAYLGPDAFYLGPTIPGMPGHVEAAEDS